METNKPSFADLEKKMAKDSLEQALKSLHDEIVKDRANCRIIERGCL